MFEDIQKHRQAVAENIEKSLQIGYTESEDFEKAHNVGDIHPNGKWVWAQLPSGKFDWRVIKVKPQDNNGLSHNYDEETNETWYEGTVNGKRVRVLQEKVGNDSWWNLEVDGKLVRNADGKAMLFESVKEAAEEAKEGTKKITKPIVPNAIIQYGNLPSRKFDQLYKDFDLQFKSYTKEQLSQAIDKIGDSVSKQISLYKRMKANGDSKIALNKQGNFIDQLSARVYTLKRLLNEKEK